MISVSFIVPGEPRAWARARRKGGQSFTDSRTRAYKQAVAAAARSAGVPHLGGPVRLACTAYLTPPRAITKARRAAIEAGTDLPTKKPDGDNFYKAVADALNGIAYADDSQITDGSMAKRWAVHGPPRMAVTVGQAQ